MQARHDEVQGEKDLRMLGVCVLARLAGDLLVIKTKRRTGNMVLVKLLFVLDALDPKESQSEQHGEREHQEHDGALRSLGGPDGEHDGQAATDQDGSV